MGLICFLEASFDVGKVLLYRTRGDFIHDWALPCSDNEALMMSKKSLRQGNRSDGFLEGEMHWSVQPCSCV